jgi:hypothetical protein
MWHAGCPAEHRGHPAEDSGHVAQDSGNLDDMHKPRTDTRRPQNDMHQLPAVLELNVGGTCLTVRRDTLCVLPDSMLAAMFSDRWAGGHLHDMHGRIFLDYNPYCFTKVLDYLRDVALVGPCAQPPVVAPEMAAHFAALTTYLLIDMPTVTGRRELVNPTFRPSARYNTSSDGRSVALPVREDSPRLVPIILQNSVDSAQLIHRWTFTCRMQSSARPMLGVFNEDELAHVLTLEEPFRSAEVCLLSVITYHRFPGNRSHVITPGTDAHTYSVQLDAKRRTLAFSIKNGPMTTIFTNMDMSKRWIVGWLLCPGSVSELSLTDYFAFS